MILLVNTIQDISINFANERAIDFFGRLFVNSISIFILIRFIYYPKNSQSEHLFTFFQIGLIIFFIASILENVKLDFGFALVLFAVFNIIRFRTESVKMKEMTYLFIIIGLSMINALMEYKISDWVGLVFSNLIIIGSAYFLEGYKPRKLMMKKHLTFRPSGLYILNSKKLLIEEIKKQTNIDVYKVDISKINAVKGEVTVWIYFNISEKESSLSIF